MMYSSAVFERPDMTLEEASIAKLDRICRKLELKPGDHVLEIGTGWGGFALHAARHYGCRVTTTTISREQHALRARAHRRRRACGPRHAAARGLPRLEGRYDKLVSIEMIEAVGHQYFDAYFRSCSELLEARRMMLLQAITIADQRYDAARDSVDFIKRYIFPGGCIPSMAALSASVARATDCASSTSRTSARTTPTTLAALAREPRPVPRAAFRASHRCGILKRTNPAIRVNHNIVPQLDWADRWAIAPEFKCLFR